MTDFDLDRVEGQVIDLRVQGVSLLQALDEPLRRALVRESPMVLAHAVQGPAPAPADAPGGAPATGDLTRWLTALAAVLGLAALAALRWAARRR